MEPRLQYQSPYLGQSHYPRSDAYFYRNEVTVQDFCKWYSSILINSVILNVSGCYSGWKLGSMLGGSKLPGIEVTPASTESYSNLPSNLRKMFEKDVEVVWKPYGLSRHQHLETMEVHIPVESGDGYFRLRVTPHNKPRETVRSRLIHAPPIR